MYNYKEETPEVRRCDAPDCMVAGEHRAPKDKDRVGTNAPDDYFWFCANHVREYNKNWDYFANMSGDEIYDWQKQASFGHRPTWTHHVSPDIAEQRVYERLAAMFGSSIGGGAKPAQPVPPIGKKDQNALQELELEHPVSAEKIKKNYKKLVKRYHPDVNNEDVAAEERFKHITAAYQHLKAHYCVRVDG